MSRKGRIKTRRPINSVLENRDQRRKPANGSTSGHRGLTALVLRKWSMAEGQGGSKGGIKLYFCFSCGSACADNGRKFAVSR